MIMNKKDIEIRTTDFKIGLMIKHIPTGIEIDVPDQGDYDNTLFAGLKRLNTEVNKSRQINSNCVATSCSGRCVG